MHVACRVLDLHRDQVELAVADATLGGNRIRKPAHVARATLKHHALNAVFMVEVRMHRRDRQVVMVMLDAHQALGQVALVVVVDVREVGHTMRFGDGLG